MFVEEIEAELNKLLRVRRPSPSDGASAPKLSTFGPDVHAVVIRYIDRMDDGGQKDALTALFAVTGTERPRPTLRERQGLASEAFGRTSPQWFRNAPKQGDSPQNSLIRALAAEIAADLPREPETSTSPPIGETDPTAPPESVLEAPGKSEKAGKPRWVIPAVAVLALFGAITSLIVLGKSDRDSGEDTQVRSASQSKSTSTTIDSRCKPAVPSPPHIDDLALSAAAARIIETRKKAPKSGPGSVGCAVSEPKWKALNLDPRQEAEPWRERRVVVQEYLDEYAFVGAYFAGASGEPTFVPGPAYGHWDYINQFYPVGYPVKSELHEDGSLWIRLSTDYPLTKGSLVAQSPSTPAWFVSDAILDGFGFEKTGFPVGQMSGPLIPGQVTQDFEKGRFTLLKFAADGRPELQFTPKAKLGTPPGQLRSTLVVDNTEVEWWIDSRGERRWVPTGMAEHCLATAGNKKLGTAMPGWVLADYPLVGHASCPGSGVPSDCGKLLNADQSVPPAVTRKFREVFNAEHIGATSCPTSNIHPWGNGWNVDLEDASGDWSVLTLSTRGGTPVWVRGRFIRLFSDRFAEDVDSVGLPSGAPVDCRENAVIPVDGGSMGIGYLDLSFDGTSGRFRKRGDRAACE